MVPTDNELARVLDHFPEVDFAFGYGSAFFPQDGYDKENVLYDYIFAVKDPVDWHTKNIKKNNEHYATFMKALGPKGIAWAQESFGSGIYFNAYITVDEKLIKYGVISVDSLIDDLKNWKTLYVSGRLHKPVKIFRHHKLVEQANQENIEGAVRTALLLLPDEFTETELFTTITGISYTGDVRMGVAENPHKVKNIVKKSEPLFKEMYDPIISNKFKNYVKFYPEINKYKQDTSISASKSLLSSLPPHLQTCTNNAFTKAYSNAVKNKLIESEHFSRNSSVKFLSLALSTIVRKSSLTQTTKGLFSAGFRKSVKYSYEKILKKVNAKTSITPPTTPR